MIKSPKISRDKDILKALADDGELTKEDIELIKKSSASPPKYADSKYIVKCDNCDVYILIIN